MNEDELTQVKNERDTWRKLVSDMEAKMVSVMDERDRLRAELEQTVQAESVGLRVALISIRDDESAPRAVREIAFAALDSYDAGRELLERMARYEKALKSVLEYAESRRDLIRMADFARAALDPKGGGSNG